jgi:hypothetical protein
MKQISTTLSQLLTAYARCATILFISTLFITQNLSAQDIEIYRVTNDAGSLVRSGPCWCGNTNIIDKLAQGEHIKAYPERFLVKDTVSSNNKEGIAPGVYTIVWRKIKFGNIDAFVCEKDQSPSFSIEKVSNPNQNESQNSVNFEKKQNSSKPKTYLIESITPSESLLTQKSVSMNSTNNKLPSKDKCLYMFNERDEENNEIDLDQCLGERSGFDYKNEVEYILDEINFMSFSTKNRYQIVECDAIGQNCGALFTGRKRCILVNYSFVDKLLKNDTLHDDLIYSIYFLN